MSKTPIFRPMSEYKPSSTACFFIYAENKAQLILSRVTQKNGVWQNKAGIAPLCWLDLEGCNTGQSVHTIVEKAHKNSDYAYAPDDDLDKQIFQLLQQQKENAEK
jgi:hypothetical protein